MNYASRANSMPIQSGSQFMVLDAGGSTVDTTVCSSTFFYLDTGSGDNQRVYIDVVDKTTPKLRISEVKPSACVQAGAIFPTRNAMTIIKNKLANSRYNVRCFFVSFFRLSFGLTADFFLTLGCRNNGRDHVPV